jgi:hypothetical protein
MTRSRKKSAPKENFFTKYPIRPDYALPFLLLAGIVAVCFLAYVTFVH